MNVNRIKKSQEKIFQKNKRNWDEEIHVKMIWRTCCYQDDDERVNIKK